MPRGPAPAWRARKEPVADSYVMASIEQADGKHDGDGFYGWCVLRMDPGDDPAEWHRALRRSAVYLHNHQIADVGIHVEKGKDAKGVFLRYVAVNKAHTYKYMIEKYGADRERWPYNPRRKGEA